MRTITAHFLNGSEFFSDYDFLSAALTVTASKALPSPGDLVIVRCLFADDKIKYDWPGQVVATGPHGALTYVIRFDPSFVRTIEAVAWSHSDGNAARQYPRLAPRFDLAITVSGAGAERRVRARNLSRNGCQLVDLRLPVVSINESVKLTWANGGTTGRVRWIRGTQFGVVFDAPIVELGRLIGAEQN